MGQLVSVSTSGQMTLPASLRKKYGIELGGKALVEERDGGIFVVKMRTIPEIESVMQTRREKLYSEHPEIKTRTLANSNKTANELRTEWANSMEGQAFLKEKYGA